MTTVSVPETGASLGNYGNNSATPGQRAFREATLQLRETLWSISSIADVRKCGKVPCQYLMPVTMTATGARLGGFCRCHSVWVCPVCAPEIRAARAVELAAGVDLHLLGEGGVEFGTATLPHGTKDRLKRTYDVVAKGWNAVGTDRSVRAFRAAYGYWGYVRTVEVTYGPNGWHPHVHWLDFWEGILDPAERLVYRQLVAAAWGRSVVRQGMGRPSDRRGVTYLAVRSRESGVDVANYVLNPDAASHELTSISTKTAKKGGMSPFDILARIADVGGMPWTGLWWEYEKATRGRRMLGSSQHLLKRLGLSELDPEPIEAGRVVALVSSDDWGALRFSGRHYGAQLAIEQAAEVGGAVAVAEAIRLLLGGHPVVPVVPDDSEALTLDGHLESVGFFEPF